MGLLECLWRPRLGPTVVVFGDLVFFSCCVCSCDVVKTFQSPKTRNTTTVWLGRGALGVLLGFWGSLRRPLLGQTVVVFGELLFFSCCVCSCAVVKALESQETRNTTTVWPERGVVGVLLTPLGRSWGFLGCSRNALGTSWGALGWSVGPEKHESEPDGKT